MAPKRVPLGTRLAVNTHNMGGCFVESVKNARWSMSPQVVGDGLESIIECQVQIKGHNQREYEDKWQGWQNCTATKLTKDDQQPVLSLQAKSPSQVTFLSLPAKSLDLKWWPDTLPEFEGEEWWQRPHSRGRCRQRKCSLIENPGFRSCKCHWFTKQMKTKGNRLDGIVFHQCQSAICRETP